MRKHTVPLLLLLGLITRMAYLLFGPALDEFLWSDMANYAARADEIIRGHWNENHFFQSALYPLTIAFLKNLFKDWTSILELLQTLISAATLPLLYLFVKRALNENTARICLLLGAFHLPWIGFNSVALPETVFTFLLASCALCSERLISSTKFSPGVVSLWALSFVLAMWLKGTHVFMGPLFLLGLLWLKRSWKEPVLAAVVVGSLMLVHGAFAFEKVGKFQLTASAGGINFLEGKCPLKSNRDSDGIGWISPLYYQLDLHQEKRWERPFTDSSYFMARGFECIKADPFVLVQSLESIPFLFVGNFTWPLNQAKAAGSFRLFELFFSLFLVCGSLLFLHQAWKESDYKSLVLFGIPMLSLFICVYVFKSEARFRLPFDLWFMPASVKGIRAYLLSLRRDHSNLVGFEVSS